MGGTKNGIMMEHYQLTHIIIMANKLKNKTPGMSFFYLVTSMTHCLPKDLLNLVFWEIESGHDMINFSEISHRCHQIFHQNLEIVKTGKFVIYIHSKLTGCMHGIYRVRNENGKLIYEANRFYDEWHGFRREWDHSGHLIYEQKWHHGNILWTKK